MIIAYFIHRRLKWKPAYGAYLALLEIVKADIWIVDISNVVSVPVGLAICSSKRLLNRHYVGYNLHLFARYAGLLLELAYSTRLISFLVILPTLWKFPFGLFPICFTLPYCLLERPRFYKFLKICKCRCLFRLCVLRVSRPHLFPHCLVFFTQNTFLFRICHSINQVLQVQPICYWISTSYNITKRHSVFPPDE